MKTAHSPLVGLATCPLCLTSHLAEFDKQMHRPSASGGRQAASRSGDGLRVHGLRAAIDAVLLDVRHHSRCRGLTFLERHLFHRWVSGTREIGRHTSELQSLIRISYAVFCLKKKKKTR